MLAYRGWSCFSRNREKHSNNDKCRRPHDHYGRNGKPDVISNAFCRDWDGTWTLPKAIAPRLARSWSEADRFIPITTSTILSVSTTSMISAVVSSDGDGSYHLANIARLVLSNNWPPCCRRSALVFLSHCEGIKLVASIRSTEP
jgi:hypothetical protein